MSRTPAENRSAFLAATLARALPDATPGAIARAVTAMQLAARAHKRDGEAACNYPRSEAQEARAAKRLERLHLAAERAIIDTQPGDRTTIGGPRVTFDGQGVVMVWCAGADRPERSITLRFGGDPRGPCGFLTISDMPGDGWSADDGFAIY